MRINFGAKPFLYPQPVMILGTYDENGKANAMNAAWGGIVGANEIIVDLSAHKTTDNIIKNKAFTVGWQILNIWLPAIMWELFPETKSRINLQKPDLQQKSPKK